ncbi:MAG: hypothetical protein DMG19_00195 [Acidobacteria bacterium]|nr:MAG: hypothetical protein DMG18_12370 [Acidobacteriota bacterium]PYR94624.1 MAG: hypothetical protein DMG19_00195 [Acidobacteriota bacterium]
MKNKVAMLFAAIVLLAIAVPAIAHHAFAAEYDADQPVKLKGKVTKFEWTNPHARFYIDVVDEKGVVSNWNLELASPNVLRRNGWTSKILQIGEEITVEGSRARDGSKMANARVVTLANGQRVFSGLQGEDAPNQPLRQNQ